MYSMEIKRLLELKKNLVNLNEYFMIINSPQVDHIKFDDGVFNIWTSDGYKFKLKIENEQKK